MFIYKHILSHICNSAWKCEDKDRINNYNYNSNTISKIIKRKIKHNFTVFFNKHNLINLLALRNYSPQKSLNSYTRKWIITSNLFS